MRHSAICGRHPCLQLCGLTEQAATHRKTSSEVKNCCISRKCNCSTEMNHQEVAGSAGEWHTPGTGVRLSFLRLRDSKSKLLRSGIFYLSYLPHHHFVDEAVGKEPDVAGEEWTDICRMRTHIHPFAGLFCWRFSMLVIDKGQKSLYCLNFQMCPPCTYLPLNSISTNPLEISVCPSLSNQLLAFSVLERKWGVLIRFIMRKRWFYNK